MTSDTLFLTVLYLSAAWLVLCIVNKLLKIWNHSMEIAERWAFKSWFEQVFNLRGK